MKSLSSIAVSLVAFVKVIADFHANHRIEANISTGGLYRDILQNGLDEPLIVEALEDGTYMILQGHRRMKVLTRIMHNHPDKFKAMFPKGVPIRIAKVENDAERVRIRADHGNVVGLTKGEVAIQWRDLKQKGFVKVDIQVRLFDQLCDVAKKRLYRSEDTEKFGTEDAATEEQEKAFYQAQIQKLTGLLQTMDAASKMPNLVFDSIVHLLDGKPGWAVYMTEAEIRKLGPIFSKDREEGDLVDEEGFTSNLRATWNAYMKDMTRSSNEDVRKAALAAKKASNTAEKDAKDVKKFDIATQIQAAKSEGVRRFLVAIQKAINGDYAPLASLDDECLRDEKSTPAKSKAS